MSKQDNVAVQFLKTWRGYNKGEVAGFPAEQAEALVNGKVAEPYGSGKKPATKQDKGAGTSKPPAANQTAADGKGAGDGSDKSPDGNGAGTGGAEDGRP